MQKISVILKKIPPILLCLCPYLFFVYLWFMAYVIHVESDEAILRCDIYYFVCVGVNFLLNFINLIFMKKTANSEKELAFWCMLIKLLHIPYYVFMFVVCIISLLLVMTPIIFMIFVAPMVVISVLISDYILTIISSSYGFFAISKARKLKLITKVECVIYTILLCIFCTDVIVSIILYIRIKKSLNSKSLSFVSNSNIMNNNVINNNMVNNSDIRRF